MKKKMLLSGSLSAILLSAVLLIMPARASVTSSCGSRNCKFGGDIVHIAACLPVKGGGCACSVPNPTFNGCVL